eukprot:contig_31337_g7649
MLPGLLWRAVPSAQVPSFGTRRSLATSQAPPALWSAVHGMFDADVPLTEPFPGVPTPTPRERPPVSPVRVTKLENGPRVASVDTGDRVSSVGLFVRAGSRYESAGANTGVCSLLEHMAFRGSARRSKFLQTRALEKTGASFGASSSREVLIYSAEGMRAASGTLIAEITEAALQPMVMGAALGTSAWDAARAEIKTQAAAMAEHPQLSAGDASVELNELLHATAYNSVGLGMTSLPKAEKVGELAPDVVASYVSASHTPDRMVLAAANVDHDSLVSHAEKHLAGLPTGSGSLPDAPAHYTGGWARSTAPPSGGGGHVAIGFESLSWAHEDLVPLCVLRTLLGGGSSFSSGGPGKGMYTRLYTGVLNVHGWVDACAAFNHVYSDTGLFGISASCLDGANLPHLVDVTTEQVGAMARVPTVEELTRAKAMTAAGLVMDLESRAVLVEDIGRQLVIGDTYMTVDEVLEQIEKVTGEQLAALAARVTGGKPTVVVVGDAYETASYEEIASAVHKQISA